ncbi:MAG: DegT/DnrJ/EryC1/StrS family aminotransferase [Micrococcales bacterium]|nr:DegT/DnrJ/EryC1/StrS family aminotransferase [Micrococcales bacterium]
MSDGTARQMIPAAKPVIGEEERAAVDAVLACGQLAQGAQVAAFESEFSARLGGGRPTVAVSSGTSALHLGLLAAGIGPGDEVVVPSFTFAATANSVALAGATPVFADIEPDTFCLGAATIEPVLTQRTAAVMPVHLYGHPAGMAEIGALAGARGLAVFEDCAQAHAATLDGRLVGTFGTFGAFSLYPTKNMTSGEGGMVTAVDERVERTLRLLRNQGMLVQYENECVGFNTRMTDVHAAIGRVQLRKLAGWTATRQANAAFFDKHLAGVGVPTVRPGAVHVYHQYTVRVPEDRDGFATALRDEWQVGCGVYYPVPNHRLASFQVTADVPETEKAAAQVLSLPVHPSLSQGDLDRIVEAVNTVAKAGA